MNWIIRNHTFQGESNGFPPAFLFKREFSAFNVEKKCAREKKIARKQDLVSFSERHGKTEIGSHSLEENTLWCALYQGRLRTLGLVWPHEVNSSLHGCSWGNIWGIT